MVLVQPGKQTFGGVPPEMITGDGRVLLEWGRGDNRRLREGLTGGWGGANRRLREGLTGGRGGANRRLGEGLTGG